jgi:hypothetical protein
MPRSAKPLNITQQWAITGGLRYYKFDEDKDCAVRRLVR